MTHRHGVWNSKLKLWAMCRHPSCLQRPLGQLRRSHLVVRLQAEHLVCFHSVHLLVQRLGAAPVRCRGCNPRLDVTSKGLRGKQGFVHHSGAKQTGGIKMKLACWFISAAARIKGLPAPRLHRQPIMPACFVSVAVKPPPVFQDVLHHFSRIMPSSGQHCRIKRCCKKGGNVPFTWFLCCSFLLKYSSEGKWGVRGQAKLPLFSFFLFHFNLWHRTKEKGDTPKLNYRLCAVWRRRPHDFRNRKNNKTNQKKAIPTPTHFNLLFVWFLACWHRLTIWNCIHFFSLPLLKST